MRSYIILLLIFLPFSLAEARTSKCVLSDGINIDTSQRLLTICNRNTAVKEFKVALGKRGIGKKYEGDKKTPLGLYQLGTPRKSWRFGTFIPIHYPTKKQRLAGFTGSDVGIHGPPARKYQLFGFLNTWYDWTHGCVAVGYNQQVAYLADWVKTHPNTEVLIR